MSTHSIGLIGYGGFGQFLHNSWGGLPEVRIFAVADEIVSRNPGGDIRFYQDLHNLLGDEEVEIVSIATPPCTHAQIACDAMEAGKHVLVEKPIATNVADGRRVVDTAKRTGRIATVDYMLRFNPIVEALDVLTREGVFGRLRHVNVENYAQDAGLPPEHWFWNRDVSGGILVEHAVHFIDVVHSLTEQRIVSVVGLAHNRNDVQEDQVSAFVLYDEGLIATHYHSFARPGFFENTSMRFNYDLAQIDVEGWIPLKGTLKALVNGDTKQRLSVLPGLCVETVNDVRCIEDVSRPEGWGKTENAEEGRSRVEVRAGGLEYTVEDEITARFDVGKPKHEVYADCVRAIIRDVIAKIENPEHRMRVTIEDGLSSLEVGCAARQYADEHKF